MRPPLKTIQGEKYDVVIVGAGVNGASAAQHLSAAGYSVLLIDKGDFASGSSNRSSRLLHRPSRAILESLALCMPPPEQIRRVSSG
jgi:glycerol-3-phosphate dehydrogenase